MFRAGPRALATPGYALVVPVPGDLAVFARLALAGCAGQTAAHRVETVVVAGTADGAAASAAAVVDRSRRSWPGPLRLVQVTGRPAGGSDPVGAAGVRADRVVVHDADAVALPAGAHDELSAGDRTPVADGPAAGAWMVALDAAYRRFATDPAGCDDRDGALLVLRVLADAFAPADPVPGLPDLATLTWGLEDDAAPMSYAGLDAAGYARHRRRVADLLAAPWVTDDERATATAALTAFDRAAGWHAAESPPSPVTAVPAPPADVTVVIPVKNRGPMLAPTLRSVLGQVPAPAAVLVVDDGSTDDSAQVAVDAGAVVLHHERSRGPGAARNTGLAAARTTWVAFCDSDDQWLPGHLAGLLRVAGDHVLATAPARTTSGRWCGNSRADPVLLDPAALLVPGEGICCSATMVRRDAAQAVGGFPEIMLAEDLALWLRLLDRASGVETEHPTVLYREHGDQLSSDSTGMTASVWDIVAEFDGRPWLTRRLRVRAGGRLAWDGMRAALRRRDLASTVRSLAWLAGHPRAWSPVLTMLRARVRARDAVRRLPMDVTMATAPVAGR